VVWTSTDIDGALANTATSLCILNLSWTIHYLICLGKNEFKAYNQQIIIHYQIFSTHY
jgi:hypothetical protein